MWQAHGPASLHQLCSKHPANNCAAPAAMWYRGRHAMATSAHRAEPASEQVESRSAWLVIDML